MVKLFLGAFLLAFQRKSATICSKDLVRSAANNTQPGCQKPINRKQNTALAAVSVQTPNTRNCNDALRRQFARCHQESPGSLVVRFPFNAAEVVSRPPVNGFLCDRKLDKSPEKKLRLPAKLTMHNSPLPLPPLLSFNCTSTARGVAAA